MIPCGCFWISSRIDGLAVLSVRSKDSRAWPLDCFASLAMTARETLIAIGAAAGIGGAAAWLYAGGGGLVEAARDPVAERGPRRRPVIVMDRRVQLRNLGHGHRRRRRRRRQRWIESRAAGEPVWRLRVTGACRKQQRGREARNSKSFRKACHGGDVVIPRQNRKRATLPARSRSDRSGRPRAPADSTTAAYAAAAAR
jgi:hypothetical protein